MDARDISRQLARQVQSLVIELLPAGKKDGAEWRCGSLAGEPGRSLSVHLFGTRAGVWSDFASGDAGDALDLVAGVLFRGDIAAALTWSRQWLGLGDDRAAPAQQRREPPPAAATPAIDPEAVSKRNAAKRLFLAAEASLLGTPAAEYLKAREIDLAELGRQPRSLRFHPALHNMESGVAWPALVAAVTNAAGDHVSTHRTWLHRPHGEAWGKAPLRDPKMSLGSLDGGCIRLWRGASGKPLAQAPQGEAVVIAEGIETALSVAVACPHRRVLCAVSLPNMARVELPPAVRTVILCGDNDQGEGAQRGLQRAIDRFAGEGRSVRVARSSIGSDFNDLLRADAG